MNFFFFFALLSSNSISSDRKMNFLMTILIILPAVLASSESDKWSWPSSGNGRLPADSRRDVYPEDIRSERIRVPTTYYDNRR